MRGMSHRTGPGQTACVLALCLNALPAYRMTPINALMAAGQTTGKKIDRRIKNVSAHMKKGLHIAVQTFIKLWCPREDSNLHGVTR